MFNLTFKILVVLRICISYKNIFCNRALVREFHFSNVLWYNRPIAKRVSDDFVVSEKLEIITSRKFISQ